MNEWVTASQTEPAVSQRVVRLWNSVPESQGSSFKGSRGEALRSQITFEPVDHVIGRSRGHQFGLG
ncbi:hypothetical protein GCM10023203_37820 [Actinomycetospora straminea]|uniref:Uncharacterized protein n=1 Tax=Actinomycetospora straminea TaxID=663607 RepID=A0ABP9EMV9_9PSEU